MAWYVFALVDKVPTRRVGKGLTGPLSFREVSGAFALVERRADVPPIEFGSLKRHQEVVNRLATQVPAILPVRFGTLLEPEHLEEATSERDDEIADAFNLVRDKVQFTWRIKRGSGIGDQGSRGAGRSKTERDLPRTGAEYLRRAAKAANPSPPAAFRVLRSKLAPLMTKQRYQAATPAIPEAVYHLVDNAKVARYVAAAATIRKTSPLLTVTGPYPPFAFAPEIL